MNGAQNLTEPVAAQADGSLSNRRDWKYFDQRLTELRVNDVENIIGRGQVLIEAHDELERDSYEATVKRHFDLSYARKLRIIAVHPVLSNRSHANALPPHPETLYQLSRLPEDVLRAKLKDGSINPKLERKDVASWRKRKDGEVTVTEKLTRKDDGSLFDLKNDSVKEIAEAIAANLSEAKAAALAKAIPEAIKELKRKRQKPAG
jgi:hypothetical protein